jgi:CBS domain-containing protein
MVNFANQDSDFAHIRVGDCMHHGILSCPGDAPLARVAAIMSERRVHAVAVTDADGGRPIGVVSDLDVVAAAATGSDPTALEAAATEPLAVSADESIHRAAQMMTEHDVAHLIVVDAAGGYPVGVLATLDIAAVFADRAPAGSESEIR